MRTVTFPPGTKDPSSDGVLTLRPHARLQSGDDRRVFVSHGPVKMLHVRLNVGSLIDM